MCWEHKRFNIKSYFARVLVCCLCHLFESMFWRFKIINLPPFSGGSTLFKNCIFTLFECRGHHLPTQTPPFLCILYFSITTYLNGYFLLSEAFYDDLHKKWLLSKDLRKMALLVANWHFDWFSLLPMHRVHLPFTHTSGRVHWNWYIWWDLGYNTYMRIHKYFIISRLSFTTH